jgi:hypothetical protein
MSSWSMKRVRVLGLLVLASCGSAGTDTVPPETRPPAELSIILLAPNHPAFFNTSTSFWAKPGRDVEGFLYFQDSGGGRGEAYARLRVRTQSLKAFPDGRPFGANDSVEITLSVADNDRVLLQMLPSGLQFASDDPAELKIEYLHADQDYNRDGKVDSQDADIQSRLAIWRQEQIGGVFTKIASVNLEGIRELQAKLFSFSRFAISY